MSIITALLQKFFIEEKTYAILMIIISLIINIIQTNGISLVTATIIDYLHKNNEVQVFKYFKIFVFISIIYILIYSLYKFFQNKLLTKLREWLRNQLVKILLQKNNDNFSEINFTKLYTPINRISYVCAMLFNDIITYILPNISFLLIIATYFLYTNRNIGIGFIIGNIILGLYLINNWGGVLIHNVEYEKYVNETELYLQEILNNIDKIIYRGQTSNEIEIFEGKTQTSINHAYKFYSSTSYHGTIMNIIVYIIIFLLIWYIIILFFDKKIDLTIFITFFTIILLYRDKMMTIIQQIPDFIEFIGRSETVLTHFKDMEIELENINNQKYESVELSFDQIKFVNVSFKYSSSDKLLFDKLNITLNTTNKIIGITGLSGNGKSTFVKLILKLYKCNDGAILIDGHDIKNIDPDYIRTHMTYVNQNSKLFDKKVVENMLYGCSDMDVCNENLKKIMNYDKIKELYKKMDIYNKQSGALGENLSGGQRQIINIIGGLINPSKILILDEPTNALDIELKRELINIIDEFRKYKQCIIIISHDRDVYPLFDETINM